MAILRCAQNDMLFFKLIHHLHVRRGGAEIRRGRGMGGRDQTLRAPDRNNCGTISNHRFSKCSSRARAEKSSAARALERTKRAALRTNENDNARLLLIFMAPACEILCGNTPHF